MVRDIEMSGPVCLLTCFVWPFPNFCTHTYTQIREKRSIELEFMSKLHQALWSEVVVIHIDKPLKSDCLKNPFDGKCCCRAASVFRFYINLQTRLFTFARCASVRDRVFTF